MAESLSSVDILLHRRRVGRHTDTEPDCHLLNFVLSCLPDVPLPRYSKGVVNCGFAGVSHPLKP